MADRPKGKYLYTLNRHTGTQAEVLSGHARFGTPTLPIADNLCFAHIPSSGLRTSDTGAMKALPWRNPETPGYNATVLSKTRVSSCNAVAGHVRSWSRHAYYQSGDRPRSMAAIGLLFHET